MKPVDAMKIMFSCLLCFIYLVFVFEYVCIQVKVNNEVATGTGPNKKVAKRNAAEAMLLQLGYKASTVLQNATEVSLLPAYISFSTLDMSITVDLFSCRIV